MQISEANIRRLFRISLWLKGAHSIVEVAGGLAMVLLTHDTIVRLASALTRGELIEDPHDVLANFVQRLAQGFSTDTQSFVAYYLFSHGLIKLVLVAAVLADRLWAYPAFIVAMIGFIIYQVYRMSHEVTVLLVGITVLDLIVLGLAWHEYRFIRHERHKKMQS